MADDYIGLNLDRLMAKMGLTIEQVVEMTGLDKRTVKGIRDGTHRSHPKTIHRLAEGLEVTSDEFYLNPAFLPGLPKFDEQTNPEVALVVAKYPEVFAGWTRPEFDELTSCRGTDGLLTEQGALESAERINRKRQVHEKLDILLESRTYAEVIGGIVDLMFDKMVVSTSD